MQEHYDEFFEVSEHRVLGRVEVDMLFFTPLSCINREVTMNLSKICQHEV